MERIIKKRNESGNKETEDYQSKRKEAKRNKQSGEEIREKRTEGEEESD